MNREMHPTLHFFWDHYSYLARELPSFLELSHCHSLHASGLVKEVPGRPGAFPLPMRSAGCSTTHLPSVLGEVECQFSNTPREGWSEASVPIPVCLPQFWWRSLKVASNRLHSCIFESLWTTSSAKCFLWDAEHHLLPSRFQWTYTLSCWQTSAVLV